jgi:hypothetical protein
MIDYCLGVFWHGLEILADEIRLAHQRGDEPVDDTSNDRIHKHVQVVMQNCITPLQLVTAATGSCVRLEDMWFHYDSQKPYTYNNIADELQRLYDEIKRDATRVNFFHYPAEMANMIQHIDEEWGDVIAAFESSPVEIKCGIDCFALGDYSGCVFHMMRVAELGLRTIAKERGVKSLAGKRKQTKPIEWGTWQEVFDAIDNALSVIRRANPGPKRDAAFSFYDTALSDLKRMRGLYRDPTMHFREKYDKGEAYDAIFRTRGLMKELATRLNEANPKRIRWRL